jgi:hypothetical protein
MRNQSADGQWAGTARYPRTPLLTLIAVVTACDSAYSVTKTHSHAVEYVDSVALAAGNQRIELLIGETVRRGYRVVSNSGSNSTGATQATVVLIGDEPGLGEVELQIEHWDQVRPDRPEIVVQVSARLPPRRQGELVPEPPAWTEMLDRIRGYLRPSQP